MLGCAQLSTPTPFAKASQTPKERLLAFQQSDKKDGATIIVLRDDGFFGGACYHGIWINGVLAGRLEPAEVATFYVEPGDYVLTIGNVGTGSSVCDAQRDRVNRETSLRPGQRKVFRALWNKNDGMPDIQPHVQ